MPSISLRTVYQTLNDLAAMGELQSLDLRHRRDPLRPERRRPPPPRVRGLLAVADVSVEGTSGLRLDGLDGFAVDTSDIVFHGRRAVLDERRRGRATTPRSSPIRPSPRHQSHELRTGVTS